MAEPQDAPFQPAEIIDWLGDKILIQKILPHPAWHRRMFSGYVVDRRTHTITSSMPQAGYCSDANRKAEDNELYRS